jgi:cytochrome c553
VRGDVLGFGLRLTASLRILLACACVAGPAHAQEQALYTRALAATCAQCHGTDGHAVPGAGIPALAGMPREEMLAKLRAFQAGTVRATVMTQLARGFSEAQLQQLADFFAAQER